MSAAIRTGDWRALFACPGERVADAGRSIADQWGDRAWWIHGGPETGGGAPEDILVDERREGLTPPLRPLGRHADRHHTDQIPRPRTIDQDLHLLLDPVGDDVLGLAGEPEQLALERGIVEHDESHRLALGRRPPQRPASSTCRRTSAATARRSNARNVRRVSTPARTSGAGVTERRAIASRSTALVATILRILVQNVTTLRATSPRSSAA